MLVYRYKSQYCSCRYAENTSAKGHADFGPTLSEGSWKLKIRDDTGDTPVWRNPDDVVVEVSDKAIIAMPSDAAYSFIGAQTGEKLYVIPQTQNPEVMWLGWNTQESQVVNELAGGANLSLDKVEGHRKGSRLPRKW